HTGGRRFWEGMATHLDFRTEKQLAIVAEYRDGRFEQNHDRVFTLGYRYPSLDKFQNHGLNVSWGRQDSRSYAAISPTVNWRFFNRLSVGASSEIIQLT